MTKRETVPSGLLKKVWTAGENEVIRLIKDDNAGEITIKLQVRKGGGSIKSSIGCIKAIK